MSLGRVLRDIKDFFLLPKPSLFDIFVCLGVIPIGHIAKEFQGLYLVFYTIFLFSISFLFKCRRIYWNVWFTMLLLWSFLGIFIHSWCVNTNSVCYKYLNFYLMSEGFIYVLFGVMYLYLIITKSRNLRLLLFTIPISLIPMYQVQLYCGQMSMVLAFVLALMVYNFKVGRVTIGMTLLFGLTLIGVTQYKWLAMKFACRPSVWAELIRVIMQHPLFGTGYNKYLLPDNMIWIQQINDKFGHSWLYRQNDYLSIAGFLGLPILIPVIGLLKHWVHIFKDSWKLIFILTFIIVSFFQITMFDPYKAFIILTIIGYLHIEV